MFKCDHCNKILSSNQNLINHENICYEKLKNENERLKSDSKKFEVQIGIYNEQFKEYKEQIKELQKTIERMGTKAIEKTTITNNNINNNLSISSSIDFNNINKIKDIINDNFNIDYAVNGQKGLAKFVVDNFLTDENGNLNYICTDPSRQIFKYKDSTTGEIKKDVEAKKLTNYIVDGGIKKKTVDVANDWYTDDSGKIDMNKFNIMLDQQQSILKMKDDNNSFKKELVTITIT
jgi:hypothetical protein